MTKKKLMTLVLCLALSLSLAPGQTVSADSKLTFISINDTLPPELINCVTTYNGSTYVPYYIFLNYGLGVSSSYTSAAGVLCLSTGERRLYFETGTGLTYDGGGGQYSTSAIVRSGEIYVPLGFTSQFFGGISYSTITNNEFGNILRITTGTQVLTDVEFLRAARTAMENYVKLYSAANETFPEVPETSELPIHEGVRVELGFVGLPAEEILEALSQSRAYACFFLTAEDVRAAPDTVRRLVCEGHGVGIYCADDPAAAYAETAPLLFEAARVCTVLLAAPAQLAEEGRTFAEQSGMVFWEHALDGTQPDGAGASAYAMIAALEAAPAGGALLLDGSSESSRTLAALLDYLRSGKYELACPRETV